MSRVAYLGPAGTFTHQAALALAPGAQLAPVVDPGAIVRAVESGECEAGVLNFESSVEGEVTASIDALVLEGAHCVIAAERVLPVSFALFRLPDDRAPLCGVASHPFALAQCRLALSGLELRSSSSTGEACAWLAAERRSGWGALAAPLAGEPHGLELVAEGQEDEPGGVTRFVLLGRRAPGPTGRDLSAFAVRPDRERPGSLVAILQEFSLRRVNLTAITSRPVKGALGEYFFYLECQGHLLDPSVRDAVVGVLELPMEVRFLGSFPEDPDRPDRRPALSHERAAATYAELRALVAEV